VKVSPTRKDCRNGIISAHKIPQVGELPLPWRIYSVPVWLPVGHEKWHFQIHTKHVLKWVVASTHALPAMVIRCEVHSRGFLTKSVFHMAEMAKVATADTMVSAKKDGMHGRRLYHEPNKSLHLVNVVVVQLADSASQACIQTKVLKAAIKIDITYMSVVEADNESECMRMQLPCQQRGLSATLPWSASC